ncbi:TIGR02117 family protein [Mesorhizobium sp. ZMM04-5]|uniref:TIGR02117 family protein n=1 Tax=Mesorhizobium marinum TaxID=3228790 RepID=A0ABV3R2H3_9HYPH
MPRWARRLLVVVAVGAGLPLIGALVPRPFQAVPETGPATRRVLMIANAIHADIAIPLDAGVLARFAPLVEAGLPADQAGVRHLVFGWGSRAFYVATPTWADLRPGPLLAALTVDESVMRVAAAGAIDPDLPGIREFLLTEAEFQRLLGFIADSFRDGPQGPVLVPASYGVSDRFFEGKGRFNALVGCNSWAAAALRSAGLRTGWWTPLPQTLDLSLSLHN